MKKTKIIEIIVNDNKNDFCSTECKYFEIHKEHNGHAWCWLEEDWLQNNDGLHLRNRICRNFFKKK